MLLCNVGLLEETSRIFLKLNSFNMLKENNLNIEGTFIARENGEEQLQWHCWSFFCQYQRNGHCPLQPNWFLQPKPIIEYLKDLPIRRLSTKKIFLY